MQNRTKVVRRHIWWVENIPMNYIWFVRCGLPRPKSSLWKSRRKRRRHQSFWGNLYHLGLSLGYINVALKSQRISLPFQSEKVEESDLAHVFEDGTKIIPSLVRPPLNSNANWICWIPFFNSWKNPLFSWLEFFFCYHCSYILGRPQKFDKCSNLIWNYFCFSFGAFSEYMNFNPKFQEW